MRQDNDANKDLYRKKIDAKEIVLDGAVNAPTSASTLISTLDKASPVNKSKSYALVAGSQGLPGRSTWFSSRWVTAFGGRIAL